MKEKITEEHLKKDIPLMIAELKIIEYLFRSINPSCLKASTIDKFSRESYRIHGLLQDIEDELLVGNINHYINTHITFELSDLQKAVITACVKTIHDLEK